MYNVSSREYIFFRLEFAPRVALIWDLECTKRGKGKEGPSYASEWRRRTASLVIVITA